MPTSRRMFPAAARRALILLVAVLAATPFTMGSDPLVAADGDDFVAFESGHVRPIALSPDGARLFVVNTPDNRLEVLRVGRGGSLEAESSVVVGLEPVAVAVLDDATVWVVNHLSDSVSVVDVSGAVPRVVRTLLVGDEPRDIVFAGPEHRRAFITTARRGQNGASDPRLTAQGVGRADVWVFDADDLGAALGGTPVDVVTLFGDTPRALAASPDGTTVYAAVFRSGNRTTVVPTEQATLPPPDASADGVAAPQTALIVQHDGFQWVDDTGRRWDQRIGFALPDLDVFAIDAAAPRPRQLRAWSGVGTILFNMVVHPRSGAVFVSNTEARNLKRFAGLGTRGFGTVRGLFVDHRITVLDGNDVSPHNLNPHLDERSDANQVRERRRALAQPQQILFTPDGGTLLVAALGSNKVARIPTASLQAGTYSPDARRQITVSGGGPSGMALDTAGRFLYVTTRFDNGVSVIDVKKGREVAHTALFNPEPASVVAGRPFLYDATLTSGRGNSACASCHVFGDNDALAWDLGDPDGTVRRIPNEYIPIAQSDLTFTWHPMKGPMTTQSMRGLANHGPMHWRGDRSGTGRGARETLEEAAFKEFNEAFVLLQGRRAELSDAQMQAFTDFALQIQYPPNPIRRLDNRLSDSERRGWSLYHGLSGNAELEVCSVCHPIDERRGVFGTAGLMSSNGQPGERDFKIPHFRDQYQKVGMFSWTATSPARLGDQVRGFGYNHNGATSGSVILADLPVSRQELADLRAFLLAFPAAMAPVVGQQVTLHADSSPQARQRLNLLVARARATSPVAECDLVAFGTVAGEPRGWLMAANRRFQPDRVGESSWSLAKLRRAAGQPGQEITFSCVPPGTGHRTALDRDRDGVLNGDDAAAAGE